jgi:hypothetical protein
VPEPRVFEVEVAIEKRKRYYHKILIKSQYSCLNQRIGQFAMRSINLFILIGIRGNSLRSGMSRSLYLFIGMLIKEIVVIIETYQFCQLHTKFYPLSSSQG